jgi:sugar/nucleoside kinase (ribokinase family)
VARPSGSDVLGIGQISLDRVQRVDALSGAPATPGTESGVEMPGGQVATAMLALARLGLRACFAGAVGDDEAADTALAPLLAARVDCSAVKRVAGGRTRRATVRVERRSGERQVHPERDPRVALVPADLERSRIEAARVLHVDAEDPEASSWAADVAQTAGIPVVLDPGPPGPAGESLLARSDFAIVSQEFALALAPGRPGEALRRVAAQARRLAVVTLGEAGALALWHRGGPMLEVPGFRVEVCDTTGAGDVFHAGFAWALLEGLGARAALRAASAAAALSCRGPGAQGGLPDREELLAFLDAQAGA